MSQGFTRCSDAETYGAGTACVAMNRKISQKKGSRQAKAKSLPLFTNVGHQRFPHSRLRVIVYFDSTV